MKVILCHNNYQVYGGAEVFYHEVGRVLAENGHEVAYFSAANDKEINQWSNYFPSVASYKRSNLFSSGLRLGKMIYNHKAKAAMTRLIRDFKPDIIHIFAIYVQLTPSILDAARELQVPVVMSCNDYKHICPNYKLYHHGHICEECKQGRFYKALVNRCCHDSIVYSAASSLEAYIHDWMNIYRRNVHTFLFASEFMARKTEDFWGADSFRWKILRNPFNAIKYIASYEIGDYAVYFGRLVEEKGVSILLDAAALAPEIPLIVVGDGPDSSKLEAQAKSFKLTNVQFVGPKWGDELDQILRKCRFVVVPSLWHENFPYVILQSFAMGKPVIASSRGGIPELVEHETRGLVYEATNAAALAGGMRVLMRDDNKVERMGMEAKHYVNTEFNDKCFYERVIQIYKEVA